MARISYDEQTAAAYKAVREVPREGLGEWREAVRRHLRPKPGMTLLDIGAGTGQFTTAFADWFGLSVLAVEPSAAMRGQIPRTPAIQVLEGDACALPLPADSADAAWLSLVLHHIPDLGAAAREIRRVLRPGAPVLIRGGMSGRIDDRIELVRWFPETARAADTFPSVEATAQAFATAGFRQDALELGTQGLPNPEVTHLTSWSCADTFTGMSVPPAEGVRVAWPDVPGPVRAAIEEICGAAVIEARTQPGGFSPGVAARVRCADGTRWFVKAASAERNQDTPRMHRQEARVLADLDQLIAAGQLPVPRLHGTVAHGPWFAMVVEDVDGRQPVLPWRDDELDLVLTALDRMAGALTPAPAAVRSTAPAIAEFLGADFTGWRTLATTPGQSQLDPWSRAHLDELAALEATWATHAAGSTLLHSDLRADNLLLTKGESAKSAGRQVMVVDWPHACRGAAFVDLVGFAPSVAMQGGPEPAELLARSRAGRNISPDSLAAVVCALAGYFTAQSLRPPPPGLPTVRQFQAAQGEVTRRWLATLLC
jgi:aminoglycoside phosphotransferase (APT) family kinase protein